MYTSLNCPIITLAWWLQLQHDKNLKIVLRSQISSSADTRPVWTDMIHTLWKWLERSNRSKISVTSIKCMYIAKNKKTKEYWNEIEHSFSFLY